MGETWEFDPDVVGPFIERFMTEVGDDLRGRKYNAFLFCNEEREVLDVLVADVDGEWAGPPPAPKYKTDEVWERIFEEAPEGATDVLCIHTHLPKEPPGPCDMLGGFGEDFGEAAKEHGMTARAIIVLHDDALDGIMFIQERGAANELLQQVLNTMARNLLEQAEDNPAIPDSAREALRECIAAQEEGREHDHAILQRAIDDLMAVLGVDSEEDIEPLDSDDVAMLMHGKPAPPPPPIEIVSPPLIIPFDPFDPNSWRN